MYSAGIVVLWYYVFEMLAMTAIDCQTTSLRANVKL